MRHFFFTSPRFSRSHSRCTPHSPPSASSAAIAAAAAAAAVYIHYIRAHSSSAPMVSQVIDEGPESSIHVNRNPSAQTKFTPVRDGEVAGIYNNII